MSSLKFLRFNYQGPLDGSEFSFLKELKTLVLGNSPSSYDTISIDLQNKYTKRKFALTNSSLEYIGVSLGYNINLASFSDLSKLKEISLISAAREIVITNTPILKELFCKSSGDSVNLNLIGLCAKLKKIDVFGNKVVFSLSDVLPKACIVEIRSEQEALIPDIKLLDRTYVTVSSQKRHAILETTFYQDSIKLIEFLRFKENWEDFVKCKFPFEISDFKDFKTFDLYSNYAIDAYTQSQFLNNNNYSKEKNEDEISSRIGDFIHFNKKEYVYKPEEVLYLPMFSDDAMKNTSSFASNIKALVIDVDSNKIDKTTWDKIEISLRKFQHLEYLEFVKYSQSGLKSRHIDLINKVLVNLKIENLHYFATEYSDLKTLDLLNQKCTRLKGIYLPSIKEKEDEKEVFPTILFKNCSLEFLWIGYNGEMNYIELNRHPKLEALAFLNEKCFYDSLSYPIIISTLGNLKKLKALFLQTAYIDTFKLHNLPLEYLSLNIHSRSISPKIILEELTQLQTLNMHTYKEKVPLGIKMNKLPKLKILYFDSYDVDKVKIHLEKTPSLEDFYISSFDCELTIDDNTALKSLQIDSEVGDVLRQLSNKSKDLEKLILTGNNVIFQANKKMAPSTLIELNYRESYKLPIQTKLNGAKTKITQTKN